eukprot:evm.model.scf_362EXC.4 EVM.evm.TU.scf_362EXC.4   scf_362EXC:34491-34826(-)
MGIRKHMNESLFDQLPVLKDLERRLDELALCAEQPSGDVQNARLILEQVIVRPIKHRAIVQSNGVHLCTRLYLVTAAVDIMGEAVGALRSWCINLAEHHHVHHNRCMRMCR